MLNLLLYVVVVKEKLRIVLNVFIWLCKFVWMFVIDMFSRGVIYNYKLMFYCFGMWEVIVVFIKKKGMSMLYFL